MPQNVNPLENELRSALQTGQLFLEYQAIVSVCTQKVIGAEALIRWNHHSGLRKPDDFIPLVEECQVILDVGDWTIFEACRQGMEWYRAGKPIRISVNVAARQLADAQFASRVWETLEETEFEPSLLELEITERIACTDIKATVQSVAKCVAMFPRVQVHVDAAETDRVDLTVEFVNLCNCRVELTVRADTRNVELFTEKRYHGMMIACTTTERN